MQPARLRVLVLDDYQDFARTLEWNSSDLEIELKVLRTHLEPEELTPHLAATDVVVAMRERTPLSSTYLSRFSTLKLVVTSGMRNDAISVPDGVVYCGTGILPHPVVELTWALILALIRRIPEEQANLRALLWQREIGATLAGRTLGLMGLGKSGSAVAKIGLAFGMRVIAYSQNLDFEHARAIGVAPVSKDELLAESDILSMHLRLSERNRNIMDAPEFAAMKNASFFINTSRAGLVNTESLVSALQRGRLAGAGLDVFDVEPIMENSPLLSAPNCLLTPHIGFVVRDNLELFFNEAIEDIRAYVKGSPVRVLK